MCSTITSGRNETRESKINREQPTSMDRQHRTEYGKHTGSNWNCHADVLSGDMTHRNPSERPDAPQCTSEWQRPKRQDKYLARSHCFHNPGIQINYDDETRHNPKEAQNIVCALELSTETKNWRQPGNSPNGDRSQNNHWPTPPRNASTSSKYVL